MKSFLNSSVPLQYLTTPPAKKVLRLQKCPLDMGIQMDLVAKCQANRNEICGFVTDDDNILYVPNSHSDPHYNFHMDIEDIQMALDNLNNANVIGVFHTHPTNIPWPSPVDIAGWPNLSLQWRYWIVTNHEVIEWCKPR